MNDDKSTRQDRPLAKGERRNPADTSRERGAGESTGEALRDAGERVGTHSLGTATGAVAGAAAGAVSGLVAGPVGALAGAIGGAALGGGMGAATGGTGYDIAAEEAYWRESHAARVDIAAGTEYADYEPAYRYALQEYLRTDHPKRWSEVEADLGARWNAARGTSRLGWNDAKAAVRDEWERLYNGTAAIRPAAPDHR